MCNKLFNNHLCRAGFSAGAVIALTVLLTLTVSISHADCAGSGGAGSSNIWIVENEDPSKPDYDLTEYQTKIKDIYNIFIGIAAPCAAVSFAVGALRMLGGDEREIAAGKKQIVLTLLALAGIFLLPLAVQGGIELGLRYGWSPP